MGKLISYLGITAIWIMLAIGSSIAQGNQMNPNSLEVWGEKDLSFGDLYMNQGLVSVPLGSAQMGKFRIRGAKNQDVLISFYPPSALINAHNPHEKIPITQVQAAYTNNSQDNVGQAKTMNVPSDSFKLKGTIPGNNKIAEAWIYVYGSINVGMTRAGGYQNTFTITVEYD